MPITLDLHQPPAIYGEAVAGQPKSASIGAAPYLALFGGEAADIGSTLVALHRGDVEGNPVLGSFGPAAIATKIALSLPLAFVMHYAAGHGHSTLAKTLGYVSGAGLSAVAFSNVRR